MEILDNEVIHLIFFADLGVNRKWSLILPLPSFWPWLVRLVVKVLVDATPTCAGYPDAIVEELRYVFLFEPLSTTLSGWNPFW